MTYIGRSRGCSHIYRRTAEEGEGREREKGERVAELREREREFARDSQKSAGKGERGSLPGFNEARDNYKRKHKRILLTRE